MIFDLSMPLYRVHGRILMGLLATGWVVAMLATSTDRAQRALGKNWKRLHRLVWFAVPLSLAHAILASGLDSPSNLLFGGLMVFAAFEYRALHRRGARGAGTHLALIGAGVLVAVLVYVVLGAVRSGVGRTQRRTDESYRVQGTITPQP